MTGAIWQAVLSAARDVHRSHPAVSAFCGFPHDIAPQPVTPFHIPAADLFGSEPDLATSQYAGFRDALVTASPYARWRETYKETDIGDDFLARFGCYCLIGDGGPFASQQMRAWMVYMPPRLHYRWHHHASEEMYLVIAGEAEFLSKGAAPETLGPGDTSTHARNQPHAMETYENPVLAYVVWRNGFDGLPTLTPAEAMA